MTQEATSVFAAFYEGKWYQFPLDDTEYWPPQVKAVMTEKFNLNGDATFFEHVPVREIEAHDIHIFVDENGLFRSDYEGTYITNLQTSSCQQVLVGPLFFFNNDDPEKDLTPLTEKQLSIIEEKFTVAPYYNVHQEMVGYTLSFDD